MKFRRYAKTDRSKASFGWSERVHLGLQLAVTYDDF